MTQRIGIGIVTFNRCDVLLGTIDRIRQMTPGPGFDMVVADDGSSDATLPRLREREIPVVTGVNMGIAWNKNRALFMLSQILGCETVILLEDDVRPTAPGWTQPWADAAARWGHVNWAAPWIQDRVVSGRGTPDDPMTCPVTSAQAAAFSRMALTYAGYFDSRFRGFGHEHVEHSRRMIRVGYGGTDKVVDGRERVLFSLLKADLDVIATRSFHDDGQVARNLSIAGDLMNQHVYRAPWQNETEMKQFRTEIDTALAMGRPAFALNHDLAPADQVPDSWWTRLRRRFQRGQ